MAKKDHLVRDVLAGLQPGLDAAVERDDLSELAARLCVDHIGYLVVNLPNRDAPHIVTTCGDAWGRQYVARQYIQIDPIISAGLTSLTPFDWADVLSADGRVQAFFEDAKAHGVKPHGIAFPVHGLSGETGIFNINVDMALSDWQHERKALAYRAQLAVLSLHQRLVERLFQQEAAEISLTVRELECLRWCADGKTAEETGVILSISERTVRSHLHSARLKLNSINTTQAVVEAVRLKLV